MALTSDFAFAPRWTADGTRLTYTGLGDRSYEVRHLGREGERVLMETEGLAIPVGMSDGTVVALSLGKPLALTLMMSDGAIRRVDGPPGMTITGAVATRDRSALAVTWVDDAERPTAGALSILRAPDWRRKDLVLGLVRSPDWSQDNSKIAVMHLSDPADPDRELLLAVDVLDGSYATIAAETNSHQLIAPVWSGDGQRILVAQRATAGDAPTNLVSIRADATEADPSVASSDAAVLLQDIAGDQQLAWGQLSQDGRRVLWTDLQEAPELSLMVESDGMTVHDLTGALGGGRPLVLAPDETELAFAAQDGLSILDLDDLSVRQIEGSPARVGQADWRQRD